MSSRSGKDTTQPAPGEVNAKDTSPAAGRKSGLGASWAAAIRAIQAHKRVASVIASLDPMERSPCVMIVRPSESARATDQPQVSSFRGLRAIVESTTASGEVRWHFFWTTQRAAQHYEAQMAKYDSCGEVAQKLIHWIDLPPRSIWRRMASLGAAFGILASLPVILTNLDAVDAS